MTTVEAEKLWSQSLPRLNKKQIADMCNKGFIVDCEKPKSKWVISDTAKKPPCTVAQAINILKNIRQCQNGMDVRVFPSNTDYSKQDVMEYLSEYSFISCCNDINELSKASVSERGIELIKSYRNDKKKSKKTKIKASGKVNVGLVQVGIDYEKSFLSGTIQTFL